MKIDKILPFAKNLLKKAVHPGDVVIDATVGNGYDTVFLAELVGASGHVFGFDIQEEAVASSRERLTKKGLSEQVTLFHSGHEHLSQMIPNICQGNITGAIFNLGYLPGSDKSIVTRPETTVAALQQLLEMIAPEGIIVLVIYHGHKGGAEERDSLLDYCQKIDQKTAHVLQYQFINQQNSPAFIIAIEKI